MSIEDKNDPAIEQDENQTDEQSVNSTDESDGQPEANLEVEALQKQLDLLKRDLAGKDKALTKLQREKMDEQQRAIEEAKDQVREEYEQKLADSMFQVEKANMIASSGLMPEFAEFVRGSNADEVKESITKLQKLQNRKQIEEAGRSVTPSKDEVDTQSLSPEERMELNLKNIRNK